MRIYLRYLLFALLFAAQACTPQSRTSSARDIRPSKTTQGWIEATAIVRDVEKQANFFTNVVGYQKIFSGKASPEVLKAWGLPESASGVEILLREPGESRGFIRLIELSGTPNQIEARSAGTFIDTGGIMGMNVRVKDIHKAFNDIQAAGWRPLSEPVSFSVDNFAVSEALFLGTDGLVLGLIEREKPVLGPEWRMPRGKLSRPNNAFVITADIERASKYYQSTLGWHSFLEDKSETAAKAGMNIYGWPHQLVGQIRRHVIWMHPDKNVDKREGTIALIKLEGIQGRDFSKTTRPPNYGWASLRSWSDSDPTQASPTSSAFQLFPYGCVILSVRHDLDGTQIEHLQPSENCNK